MQVSSIGRAGRHRLKRGVESMIGPRGLWIPPISGKRGAFQSSDRFDQRWRQPSIGRSRPAICALLEAVGENQGRQLTLAEKEEPGLGDVGCDRVVERIDHAE